MIASLILPSFKYCSPRSKAFCFLVSGLWLQATPATNASPMRNRARERWPTRFVRLTITPLDQLVTSRDPESSRSDTLRGYLWRAPPAVSHQRLDSSRAERWHTVPDLALFRGPWDQGTFRESPTRS